MTKILPVSEKTSQLIGLSERSIFEDGTIPLLREQMLFPVLSEDCPSQSMEPVENNSVKPVLAALLRIEEPAVPVMGILPMNVASETSNVRASVTFEAFATKDQKPTSGRLPSLPSKQEGGRRCPFRLASGAAVP